MKNIIVNLKKESDLYEKYNDNVSKELIDYLLKQGRNVKSDIKITINTKLNIDKIDDLIKKGLKEYYNETTKFDEIYDTKQVSFFIMGLIFLIIATFVKYEFIKEIIIILGWFVIWEGVDITLNLDTKLRKNRNILKKLMKAKIEINKN